MKIKSNCTIWLFMFFSFLECITATDCPNGGTNFLCNANTCECKSPNILVGDKCVGKLML